MYTAQSLHCEEKKESLLVNGAQQRSNIADIFKIMHQNKS